jgi:hypothetical protein
MSRQKGEPIRLSVALYSEPQSTGFIPVGWMRSAAGLLSSFGLPVVEFSAEVIAGESPPLLNFPKNEGLLVELLERGNVNILGLYTHRRRESDLVMDWEGLAYFDLPEGLCFLGVPAKLGVSPGDLLRSSYELYKGHVPLRYGTAYYHSGWRGPDFYAVGMLAKHAGMAWEDEAYEDRVTKWLDEMQGQRRYLRGWFRGAYPASLLSETHVSAFLRRGLFRKPLPLRESGLGTLTPLGEGLWLWELSEAEVATAEKALGKAGLLIK